jgi:hypothetical protein
MDYQNTVGKSTTTSPSRSISQESAFLASFSPSYEMPKFSLGMRIRLVGVRSDEVTLCGPLICVIVPFGLYGG